MYKIEKKPYGVRLTFSGKMSAQEMHRWLDESRKVIPTLGSSFGNLIDMRDLKTLDADAQTVMKEGQKFYRQSGMNRSVVIVSSQVVAMQFKRVAKETGIYDYERYISASDLPGWEKAGIAWLEHAVDPDHAPA